MVNRRAQISWIVRFSCGRALGHLDGDLGGHFLDLAGKRRVAPHEQALGLFGERRQDLIEALGRPRGIDGALRRTQMLGREGLLLALGVRIVRLGMKARRTGNDQHRGQCHACRPAPGDKAHKRSPIVG